MRKGVLKLLKNSKRENGLSDLVVFHQLDVLDPSTIASLADFIKTQFGRLDIVVNNVAIGGITVDTEAPKASAGREGIETDWIGKRLRLKLSVWLRTAWKQTTLMLKELFKYFFLSFSYLIHQGSLTFPIMLGSDSMYPNEWAVGLLSDAENLSEDKVDEILSEFMKDFKEDQLEAKNWPTYLSAYILLKAAMNAYTRIVAKTHPRSTINCVCPGYVKTNRYAGLLTVEEGASSPVRLALLPPGGPSGVFFSQKEVSFSTEITV